MTEVPDTNADETGVEDSSSGRIAPRDFDIPYRYEVTATTAELHEAHGELEDGS